MKMMYYHYSFLLICVAAPSYSQELSLRGTSRLTARIERLNSLFQTTKGKKITDEQCMKMRPDLQKERNRGFSEYDEEGHTVVTRVIRDGYSDEFLAFLLGQGASVDEPTQDGDTPLMCAVLIGSVDKVKLLLNWGASLYPENHKGKSARDLTNDPKIKEALQVACITTGCSHED